tara:strand:- start:467 stop:877 length:411 start_codon:yes stop_codon:yes gene_type:complete
MYYTYAYLREDGTPYYIGKGTGRRLTQRNCKSVPIPKDKNRIVKLKENLTEEEAFDHEIETIAYYGRKDNSTGILRNLTDGGEGFSSKKMMEVWEKFRERKMQEWRDDCDKKTQWREENYSFLNELCITPIPKCII